MLFGKRKRIVKRILVVEDEPLTAFDNETMLIDAGYEVVATLDSFDDALEVIEREMIDLILSDIRLRSHETGIDLALAAKQRGIPTLFASGHEMPAAAEVAIGCLRKPYTERQLRAAIDSVDRHLSGQRVRPPRGLELFIVEQG
jgi:CheY-like chemotaxis protein